MTAGDGAALGAAWLGMLIRAGRRLELDPAELAVVAVRCPTTWALEATLPEITALGPGRWRAGAFARLPADLAVDARTYCELHEWLILHVLLDGETELPEGPAATALLRGAFDPDAGVFRFGSGV